MGLRVNKFNSLSKGNSSFVSCALRAPSPFSRQVSTFSRTANSAFAALSPLLAILFSLSARFWVVSKSARHSSVLIISISRNGSTDPETWVMFSSSKQRTTSAMASVSRMWLRNLFPSPSPLEAPATRPAISTKRITAGTTLLGWYISVRTEMRLSGTSTTPTFGSIVQNG